MKLDAINAARPRFLTSVAKDDDDGVNGVWARPSTMRKSTTRKITARSHGLLKVATASAVLLATARAPSLAHAGVLLPGGGPPIVASVAALLLLQWPAAGAISSDEGSAEEGSVRRRDLSVLVSGSTCFDSNEKFCTFLGVSCTRKSLQEQCDAPTSSISCCTQHACEGASGIVCAEACSNGSASCQGFMGTAKRVSCIGTEACKYKWGNTDEYACRGNQACQDHKGDVGIQSCFGEKACSQSISQVMDYACRGKCSCFGNKSEQINSRTCNSPCGCADFTGDPTSPDYQYCKAVCRKMSGGKAGRRK